MTIDWTLIFEIATLVAGGLLAIWLFRAFQVVIEPTLDLRWADDARTVLIIRIQMHNKAKVYMTLSKAQLQIFERDLPASGYISEFVPFMKEDDRADPPIPSGEWHEPTDLLATTNTIEPGEIIRVERAYRCKSDLPIVHCALQVRAKITARMRIANLRFKPGDRWTTTVMATRYRK